MFIGILPGSLPAAAAAGVLAAAAVPVSQRNKRENIFTELRTIPKI